MQRYAYQPMVGFMFALYAHSSQYTSTFRDAKIKTVEQLRKLSEGDLSELGVRPLHIKLLLEKTTGAKK